jgi:hypothetical protein
MNRIVATPPGQPVPQLGGEIEESDESIKRRKKGGRIEWNLHDTYTFSLWSAYCDFLEWRCQNLPGIRPFSLNGVIGAQSINLVLYEIPEENEKHMRCDMKIIAEFEMSNVEKSSAGRMAKEWQLEYGQQDSPLCDHHAEQSLEHHHRRREDDSGNQSGSYVDAMMEQDLDLSHTDSVEGEEVDEAMELGNLDDETTEEEAAAELGAGIYVQSGDKIVLRESNFSRDQSDLESDAFVTTGGGFAVLQEQSSSAIIIEKRGRRRSQSASSKPSRVATRCRLDLSSRDERAKRKLDTCQFTDEVGTCLGSPRFQRMVTSQSTLTKRNSATTGPWTHSLPRHNRLSFHFVARFGFAAEDGLSFLLE